MANSRKKKKTMKFLEISHSKKMIDVSQLMQMLMNNNNNNFYSSNSNNNFLLNNKYSLKKKNI